MRVTAIALAGLLLPVSCDQGELKTSGLRRSYLRAECRFYTESDCVDAMSDSCGGAVQFDSEDDCVDGLDLALSDCAGLDDALDAAADDVNDCIDALGTFECGGDEPVCDESGATVMERDACAVVQQVFADACDGDTGR